MEAEGRYQRLVQVKAGSEGYKLFVARSDAYPIKGGDDVEFSKDLNLVDSIKGLLDQQQRITVLKGDIVHPSVIDIDTDATTRLPYDQQRARRARL